MTTPPKKRRRKRKITPILTSTVPDKPRGPDDPPIFGYARVSMSDQSNQRQVDELVSAGVAAVDIFSDTGTGATMDRPGWEDLVKQLEPGDVLVIHSIDRLSRNLVDTMTTLDMLHKRGVRVKVLTMDFDSTTPMGKFVFAMLSAFSQFERDVIHERTMHGIAKARERGVERLPTYATSAVRKAANPQDLLGPLAALGIETKVLSEEDEGRLNLLGAAVRSGRKDSVLVIDPGGDSTECTADMDGGGWMAARVASLPFGSVSLQEAHGSAADNDPIAWERLAAASAAAKAAASAHPLFGAFVGAGLIPAIRINAPIQRALEQANGRPLAAHGEGGTYGRAELERLCRRTASLGHAGRAALLDGEPIGKVDRTCYGFASWLGILDALGADAFQAEPWGIKLGAVIALNSVPST